MKILLALLILSLQANCLAAQILRSDSVGYGTSLRIDGRISLPPGYHLNPKAPSKIDVYEMGSNGWALVENVDLNDFFSLTELIHFQRPIALKSDRSEIKIEASLYHCPKAGHGICVIDDFETLVKRNKNKETSEIHLALNGRDPRVD